MTDSDFPPACWHWVISDEVRGLLAEYRATPDENDERKAFLLNEVDEGFTRGRCGICSRRPAPVEDHDHITGLIRGWLCRSCNIREGRNRHSGEHTVWTYYRQKHPYSILGIQEKYDGYGWENGEPIGGWAAPAPLDQWKDNAMRGVL